MAIKAVAVDVDGVLTDGTVWVDEAGREIKRVSFADIMGVSIGRRAGLHFALVSGEGGPVLDQIAAKFHIDDVYRDCRDKAAALRDFAARHHLTPAEVCFIGDDVNDLEALQASGLAAAPADAHPAVRSIAAMVTDRGAGAGSLREVVDLLTSTGPASPSSSAKQ